MYADTFISHLYPYLAGFNVTYGGDPEPSLPVHRLKGILKEVYKYPLHLFSVDIKGRKVSGMIKGDLDILMGAPV